MGQSASAGWRIFFDSWQAGRRAEISCCVTFGTVWNSSQKLPPPHNSTQWDCSQGGWGIVRRSSPIELPLKCLTHRITNAMGDAMSKAFSLKSSFVPRAGGPFPTQNAKDSIGNSAKLRRQSLVLATPIISLIFL